MRLLHVQGVKYDNIPVTTGQTDRIINVKSQISTLCSISYRQDNVQNISLAVIKGL